MTVTYGSCFFLSCPFVHLSLTWRPQMQDRAQSAFICSDDLADHALLVRQEAERIIERKKEGEERRG